MPVDRIIAVRVEGFDLAGLPKMVRRKIRPSKEEKICPASISDRNFLALARRVWACCDGFFDSIDSDHCPERIRKRCMRTWGSICSTMIIDKDLYGRMLRKIEKDRKEKSPARSGIKKRKTRTKRF